jgi:hypothetical protein
MHVHAQWCFSLHRTHFQVTPDLIEWFENGCLSILVHAVQEDTKPDAKLAKLTTKELRVFEEHAENQTRRLSLLPTYATESSPTLIITALVRLLE